MRQISSNIVTKNMEQVAPKVEKIRGSQPLGSGGKKHPSKAFKKESWYDMAIQNSQEKDTSRNMFKGSKSLDIDWTIMAGTTSMS